MTRYANLSHLVVRRVSAALGRHVEMIALVPEEGNGPFPAVLLLHGMMDDHTTWLRRTALERHLLGRGMAVLLPNGARSWWSDAPPPGDRYESLALETCDYGRRLLPLRQDRAGWAVAGVSMGGYGALKLGWKHAGRFAAIAALAPVADIVRHRSGAGPGSELTALFPSGVGPEDDPLALAARAAEEAKPAGLVLACGGDDPLLPESLALRRVLRRVNYPHRWRRFRGAHFWDAWDAVLPRVLDDLGGMLGLATPRDAGGKAL